MRQKEYQSSTKNMYSYTLKPKINYFLIKLIYKKISYLIQKDKQPSNHFSYQ